MWRAIQIDNDNIRKTSVGNGVDQNPTEWTKYGWSIVIWTDWLHVTTRNDVQCTWIMWRV